MAKKKVMKKECLSKVTGGVGSSEVPVSEEKGMGIRADNRELRAHIRELFGRKPRRRR